MNLREYKVNERIKEFEKQCWDNQTNHLNVEKFAFLVAAHEREACAKLCDEFDAENPHIGQGRACAFEIRARDGEPGTYCHTYYPVETGACIQHGEWARTAGLGCPACNGEIEACAQVCEEHKALRLAEMIRARKTI